jgi:hypothetical protein
MALHSSAPAFYSQGDIIMENWASSRLLGGVLSAFAVLMWGCAATPEADRRAAPATTAEKPASHAPERDASGWVFGRIAVIDKKGKEISFSDSIWTMSQFSVWLRSQQTGILSKQRVLGDGSFLWKLEPGEYVLAGFSGNIWESGPLAGRLWGKFTVKPVPQASYIGTISVRSYDGYYRFGLKDDYEQALEKVNSQLQSAGREPVKVLLAFEDRLGNYEAVSAICAEEWGLECGLQLSGVEPVHPENGSGSSFPTAESLSPTFEWKPAAKAGIKYDLAIYESLSLPGAAMGKQIRGELVTYAEALSEPRFALDKVLKPDTKYQWSVRLREGTKVSSWSTTGYFAFFVVGYASGYGYWFQFSTP